MFPFGEHESFHTSADTGIHLMFLFGEIKIRTLLNGPFNVQFTLKKYCKCNMPLCHRPSLGWDVW